MLKFKNKLSKQVTKYLLTIILMVIVTIVALIYVLKDDPRAVFTYLGNAKFSYVCIMLALEVAAILIEGLVLTILSRLYLKKYHWYQGTLNGLIGSFFSAITPFSSGGQFAQVYTFSKQGVKAVHSASILVMLFIVSQTIIVLYGLFAMIFGYQTTILKMQNINFFGISFSPIVFSIIGFTMNVVTLFGLFLLAYLRPLHHFILTTGINIASKLHLVKDKNRERTKIAAYIATFRIELTRLFKNIWVLLITLLLEIAKFTCMYSLPYFAGASLGVNMDNVYFQSLWSNSYLNMIVAFIPLPGGSGVYETSFQLLYASIFNDNQITSAANLLSRGISFYFTLFVGLIVFLGYQASPKKIAAKYDLQKTFVDLRIISMATNELPVLKENDREINYTTNSKNIGPFKIKPIDEKTAKKEALIYYSTSQLMDSFKEINKLLEDSNIEKDDSPTSINSKNQLKNVYLDVKSIEERRDNENKKDTEIELAIKKDLEALINEEKKKKERKMRSLLKRKNKKWELLYFLILIHLK